MSGLTMSVPTEVSETSVHTRRRSLLSRKPPPRRSGSQGHRTSRSLSSRNNPGTSQVANIIAACRFRPMLSGEKGDLSAITYVSDRSIRLNDVQEFTLDKIFRPCESQEEVFTRIGKSVVEDVVAGFNGSIFAYGQTGSGKTYTMIGTDLRDPESLGLIPRCGGYLLTCLNNNPKCRLTCSMVEIYREKLIDLLHHSEQPLKVKENPESGVFIQGLSQVTVTSEKEILSLLRLGTAERTVAATTLNQISSRSHAIFTMQVKGDSKSSFLNLVDLAGSERLSTLHVANSIVQDAKKINLSLSVLGAVISALASKAEHVPYRDSKLTRVLQESLGGNCKTHVIVNCSPALSCLEETVMSLRFALRTKRVKNEVNVRTAKDGLERQIEVLETELRSTREELKKYKERSADLSTGIPPITPRRYRSKEREVSPTSFECSCTYRILTEAGDDSYFDSGKKLVTRSPADNPVSFSPDLPATLLLDGDSYRQRDVLESILKRQQKELAEVKQERDEFKRASQQLANKLKQVSIKYKACKNRQDSDSEKRKILLLKIASDEGVASHMKSRIALMSKQVHQLTQALEDLQESFGYSGLKENLAHPESLENKSKFREEWKSASLTLKYEIKDHLCNIQSDQVLALESAVDMLRHSNTRLRNELINTYKDLADAKFSRCSKSQAICDFLDSQEVPVTDDQTRFSFADGLGNVEFVTRKLKLAEVELEEKQKEITVLQRVVTQSQAAVECMQEALKLESQSRVSPIDLGRPHTHISGDIQPPDDI